MPNGIGLGSGQLDIRVILVENGDVGAQPAVQGVNFEAQLPHVDILWLEVFQIEDVVTIEVTVAHCHAPGAKACAVGQVGHCIVQVQCLQL